MSTADRYFIPLFSISCWWFRNPVNSPVVVGSLFHWFPLFTGFKVKSNCSFTEAMSLDRLIWGQVRVGWLCFYRSLLGISSPRNMVLSQNLLQSIVILKSNIRQHIYTSNGGSLQAKHDFVCVLGIVIFQYCFCLHPFRVVFFIPLQKSLSNWIISPSRAKNEKYLKPRPSFANLPLSFTDPPINLSHFPWWNPTFPPIAPLCNIASTKQVSPCGNRKSTVSGKKQAQHSRFSLSFEQINRKEPLWYCMIVV